jgi:DNA helicase-2/ATP-dependent DNA helicase PcrA
VFIVGLEDGIFPHYRSMTDTAELEEERRLLYVGITRAQRRLYLCHAWGRTLFGQTSFNPPSRFLNEIPPPLLDVREEGAPAGRGSGARDASRGGRARRAERAYSVVGLPGKDRVEVAATGWTPPAPPKKRELPAVAEGDTVLHDRWGEGVVLTVRGQGDDAEATIAFSEAGEKRLLLSYAPLRKVG